MPEYYNFGTTINGQPNYQIGMQMDPGLLDASNEAFQNAYGAGGMMNMNFGGGGGGNAPHATATTQEVQDDQLMSHQLTGLLDQNSPYMQLAARRGGDMAAGRGSGNSSAYAGASMRSAIEAGAPIAQFDAGRYGTVADQNMAAENQMEQLNAQNAAQLQAAGMSAAGANMRAAMGNRGALQQMLLGHQLGALDDVRRQGFGLEEREDQQAFQGGQSDIDRWIQQQQYWGGEMPFNYSQLGAQTGLQQNQQYLDAYGQSQQSYLNPIMAIYSNPNLTGEQQNAAVENWMNMSGGFASGATGMMPPWMQDFQPATINPGAWQAASNLPPMPPVMGGGG